VRPSDQAHSKAASRLLVLVIVHVVIHSMLSTIWMPSSSSSSSPYCIALRVVTSKLHAWPAFRQHDYTDAHCPAREAWTGGAEPEIFCGLGVVASRRNRCRFTPGDTSGRAMAPFLVIAEAQACCDSQHHPCILSICAVRCRALQ